MFNVYIREAHPADGWDIPTPDKKKHNEPTTFEERKAIAKALIDFEGPGNLAQIPMLIDDPETNALSKAYEAGPERIVILDRQLEVVHFTGQGPFQYDLEGVKEFLHERLNPSKPLMGPCQCC